MKKIFTEFGPRGQITFFLVSVLAIILAFYLPWNTMRKQAQALSSQKQESAHQLAMMQTLIDENREFLQSATPFRAEGQSLLGLIDSSLADNDLNMSRLQQTPTGEIQLRLTQAPFEQVLAWLYRLESEPGLSIASLSLSSAGGDGQVSLSVQIDSL